MFLFIDFFIFGIILSFIPKDDLILKKIIKFLKLLKRRIDILNAETKFNFILEKLIMGFAHCPICVVLTFVSGFIGFTRSYMFFTLFREFMRPESNF